MMYTSKPKKYENPAPGLHPGLLRDIVLCRNVDTYHPGKFAYSLRFIFQLGTKNSYRNAFWASEFRPDNMKTGSKLRIYLASLMNRELTEAEVENGFDLDSLIGRSYNLVITLKEIGDKTFANASTVLPLVKGEPPVEPEEYIRLRDRPNFVPVPPEETDDAKPTPDAATSQATSVKDGVSTADLPTSKEPPPNTPFTATDADLGF